MVRYAYQIQLCDPVGDRGLIVIVDNILQSVVFIACFFPGAFVVNVLVKGFSITVSAFELGVVLKEAKAIDKYVLDAKLESKPSAKKEVECGKTTTCFLNTQVHIITLCRFLRGRIIHIGYIKLLFFILFR